MIFVIDTRLTGSQSKWLYINGSKNNIFRKVVRHNTFNIVLSLSKKKNEHVL